MADFKAAVPKQIQQLFHHLFEIGRNFSFGLSMQEHHIHVARRIEFAPAVTTNRNQGDRFCARAFVASRRRGRDENVFQQNIDKFSAAPANLATDSASLMF